ncbi:hypothetical protein [Nocardia terpenica]|uniref:Uncharacterized protein n=1 Tax=Nocardia terpenica TaxID=455432 RepID=A0A164K953_9NOCA|nr:hypothetical protein [Nocardia terpenica]KZM71166.1 hypothetical protein AWN90_42440 [Nocardia terpenica]NQE89499.1 hypothetical protein [Nocardia terpenica]
MAQLRGETPARGWQHEQAIVLGKGKGNTRIHDTARTNEQGGREFTEYKYGMQVRADAKTLNQLILDREVLTRDQNATGTWVMRAGAADATLRQQLDALHRDFPGRFQVVEISREEAEKARKLGRSLEQQAQGVQRELHDVPQLIRSQQQRARENKTRVQEAVARAVARQEAEKTAERARQQALARLQQDRAQLLARFPPEVAHLLELAMPPPAQELEARTAGELPDAETARTRAGRESRVQERGREPRQR